MSDFGGPEEAEKIGKLLIDYLQENYPDTHPMTATAAMAMALGAMVASMGALGLTKPGRSGHLLDHLFKMAEGAAERGLEDA